MPALRMHATEGFRIHITDRTDDDFRLGFGAHGRDSTRGVREGEIEGMFDDTLPAVMEVSHNDVRRSCTPGYDRCS
ncbi:hypothetical protein GCM10009644_18620 [Microbacterium oxydans]